MRLSYLTPFTRSRSAVSNDAWPGSIFSLHREMDKLFGDVLKNSGEISTSADWTPRVNIAETEKDFQISAELPGIEEKDVEVTLHDGVLTIKGQRQSEAEQKDKNFHRIESFYGSFERSFALPDNIAEDKVDAKFKNGLLTVIVGKMEQVKPQPKKIQVKAS